MKIVKAHVSEKNMEEIIKKEIEKKFDEFLGRLTGVRE